ncbi:MAG TPA: vitamin K epoxide reductase family protein [Burkholderiales bacterium]|nr:vitamin K epoxide reductase family protein [Burkholderiales bacterium]
MLASLTTIKKESPAALRHALRQTNAPEILLRRAVVGASLVGIACMAVTTLFQMGMVKHLADPPLEGFDSDKVNASDLAYGWGMPDSPLSIGSHAAAIALAAAGGVDRARTQPAVPLAATAAALPAAATAARYLFHDMPVREKGWCPYCIVDALAHLAVFGFTLWESKNALRHLSRG